MITKNRIPQHKASLYIDSMVVLHKISIDSTHNHAPIKYAHQDDYYIFGLLTKGTAHGFIDFKELHLKAGDAFIVQPGQVHRFVSFENAEGWLMMADSRFVGDAEKLVFDSFSLLASSFSLDEHRAEELREISVLLEHRLDNFQANGSDTVITRLTEVFVAIVAEAAKGVDLRCTTVGARHREIVLSFRTMLAEHLYTNRQPSYYASLLNISTVYLNEVVKKVTGMSTALYIKNEVVLQAKRLLVNTTLSVKQIADKLGFDDSAYFSRLFSQSTGVSPALFRHKSLD